VFPDDALEGTVEKILSVVAKAKAEKWTAVCKTLGEGVGEETWARPDAKALRVKELFEQTKHCMVVLHDKQGFASPPERQLRSAVFFECLPESVDDDGTIGESPESMQNMNVLKGENGSISFLFLSEYVALTTMIGNAAGRIPTAEGSDTLGAIERLIKVAVTCVAGEAMAAPLPLAGVPPAPLTTDAPAQVADASGKESQDTSVGSNAPAQVGGDGGETNAGQKRRREASPLSGVQRLDVGGSVEMCNSNHSSRNTSLSIYSLPGDV
jgi:hypothetical protein